MFAIYYPKLDGARSANHHLLLPYLPKCAACTQHFPHIHFAPNTSFHLHFDPIFQHLFSNLLHTNTYFVCIIYLFMMTFYVLVLKITNSVMLNFLCPTTIQPLIIFYIFSRRTNSGILCSACKPHEFQLSSHLPVLGHIYSDTNLVGTTLPCNTCLCRTTY
jgi:uncharacterized integral membrane protein